jgi:hypothetical protein
MPSDSLFFPELRRRKEYSTKRNGEHYVYSRYKQEIREDCLGRCVYCDAHENENGGAECMELDHFRPQKYKEHEHLVNDPNNLVWACRGCNRLKSDHWPALGIVGTVLGNEGFIDPFEQDRQDYFAVLEDGKVVALRPPAGYMITLLALNRSSRKRLRELRYLKQLWVREIERESTRFERLLESLPNLTDEQFAQFYAHAEWLRSLKDVLQSMLDFCLY